MSFTSLDEFLQASKSGEAIQQEQQLTYLASLEEVRARAKVDFNYFAGLVAPRVMRLLFPDTYLGIFRLLTTENVNPYDILRFALGLPRGFVKTTFLKILVVYFIVHDMNFFVLVVCATEGKARAFISDVDNMLSSPQVEQIYGRWSASKLIDNQVKKVGTLNGQLRILLPAGSGSAIRGANEDNRRPDLIICDDIQGREEALSEVQNAALIEWFTSTLIKSIDIWGTNRRIIYLGNMFPGECLLKKLKDNPEWISLVTGAILADGQSFWPELKPIEALIKEYKHDEAMGLGHIWFAEVQNDPLDAKYRLLAAPIPPLEDGLLERQHDVAFLTIDPAGFRDNSDDNVIATHCVYDGFPVCTKLHGGQWDPKETVVNAITEALRVGACLIGIESVGYQQSLCFWLDFVLKRLNITWIQVVELKTRNASKQSRISDYIKELLAGNSGMAPEARTTFTYYASMYRLGKTKNKDDYLDAPAYQKQVLTDYHKLLMPAHNREYLLENLPDVVDVPMS